MIEAVAARLAGLINEVVFVGGATTALLVTDSAVTDIRPTYDVDLIVEVGTYARYTELEERMRSNGFIEVIESGAPSPHWRSEVHYHQHDRDARAQELRNAFRRTDAIIVAAPVSGRTLESASLSSFRP
jgi:nucleotide-binding universal stress UspA family protein